MIVPFPIYVDEISEDKVKATVSNGITIFYNLRTMALDMPAQHLKHLYTVKKGLFIVPVGKFICMLLRNGGNGGMIFVGRFEVYQKYYFIQFSNYKSFTLLNSFSLLVTSF